MSGLLCVPMCGPLKRTFSADSSSGSWAYSPEHSTSSCAASVKDINENKHEQIIVTVVEDCCEHENSDECEIVSLSPSTSVRLFNNCYFLCTLLFSTILQGMKEDGNHLWKLRRFKRPAMCNICLQLLVAWGGKQGLSCTRKFVL
jgi:hypothetical protein